MNQLLSQQEGGALVFKGTVSEPASVTVGGKPATATADNRFEGQAVVPSGTGQVVVAATDPSGNLRTNIYEVSQGATSKSFTYDANGNMTSDGTRTYEWDAENRLVAVKEGGATVVSYTYNKDGIRASKTAGGVTTSYVLRGSILAEERLSTGGTAKHFEGSGVDDMLGSQDGAGVVTYFTRDHLGSIREQVDTMGTGVVLRRDYDPWGRPAAGAGTGGWAFTGRENDVEAGLYYYRARYYDSRLGRFLTIDPLGSLGALKPYTYVSNKPVSARDPHGLYELWGFDDLGLNHDMVKAIRLVYDKLNEQPCCAGDLGPNLLSTLLDDRLVFQFAPAIPQCGVATRDAVLKGPTKWPILIGPNAWGCCDNTQPPLISLAATIIHELVHVGRPDTMHHKHAPKRRLPYQIAHDCFDCDRPEELE